MKLLIMHEKKRHEVLIAGSATIMELKEKLQPITGVDAEAQSLSLVNSRDPLCDELPLSQQGVQEHTRPCPQAPGSTASLCSPPDRCAGP